MPRLSVYFIRTSLVFMLLGFTIGALILANKGIPFLPAIWIILPAHMEIMFIGWIIQLAMGVAFWILPRFSTGSPRGAFWMSWAAYFCINAGILIFLVNQFAGYGWIGLAGEFLVSFGVLSFVLGNWKRVKPSGA